jgi:Type I phosphodiesterase / nucleotide pyrophosphatase
LETKDTRGRRRLIGLLLAAGLVATPAAALRVACVGHACDRPAQGEADVPFCSLPPEVRSRIEAGFREERSPDVFVLTGRERLSGFSRPAEGQDLRGATFGAWPSAGDRSSWRVPIVFAGSGVLARAEVPAGTGLADIAPTIARVLALVRPHPEVRSGRALEDVTEEARPRLVLLVVWKGVGSDALEAASGAWPFLQEVMDVGAGTLEGDVGSLPLDPAAALATIGTGGRPSEHGITGRVLRDQAGRAVPAWSPRAPISVIASLGEDLDRSLEEEALVGLVATDRADRGGIGGTWYLDADRDDVIISGGPAAAEVAALGLLRSGYGRDALPDLLVVASSGSERRLDTMLEHVVRAAEDTTRGSLLTVVTATGDDRPPEGEDPIPASLLVRGLDQSLGAETSVVEAAIPGGLFLDQDVLADQGIASDRVVHALLEVTGPSGSSLVADAFPAIAVTLGEYC